MSGTAHLVDFGLAKNVVTHSRFTRTGQTLGTLAYMSPEQARGELGTLTPATDVWSLACVCYEAVTGRAAFEGPTPAAVVAAILTGRRPAATRLVAGVPAALDELLGRALEPRAGGRFPDARALREACDAVLAGRRPAGVRRRGRRTRAIAAAGLGAAACAGAIALSYRRWATPPPIPGALRPVVDTAADDALWQDRFVDPRASAEALERLAAAGGPAAPRCLVRAGLCRLLAGDYRAAERCWAAVPPDAPERARALLLGGLAQFVDLDTPTNRSHWQAAAALSGPAAVVASGGLAVLDAQWGVARRLLDGRPGWEAALLRAYAAQMDPAGDPAAACADYTTALQEGIGRGWIHNNRALVKLRQGDLASALADLDQAVRLEAGYPSPLMNRGAVHERMGHLDAAEADFTAVIAIRPDWVDARCERARLYIRRERYAEALADARHAAAVASHDPLPPALAGSALTGLGRYGEALAALDQAAALDPTNAEIAHAQGHARSRAGDAIGALRDYTRAIELDGTRAVSYFSRGTLRWHGHDPEGAEGDLRRAIALDSEFPLPCGNLGLLLQEGGRPAEAIPFLRRFLDLVPEHPYAPRIRTALAECEAAAARPR